MFNRSDNDKHMIYGNEGTFKYKYDNPSYKNDEIQNETLQKDLIMSEKQINSSERIHSFEEAIELAGHGKFHYLLLFVCGGCIMGVAIESLVLSFALPSAKCDLKFTITEQGILNSIGFIGIVLSSHFWGFMADTWGRIKVMRLSLSLTLITSIISGFSISVTMLIVTRLFSGLFISGVQATAFSYLGEFHGNRTRLLAVTRAAMFLPFSMVILSILGWIIVPMEWIWFIFDFMYKPWRLLLLCSSLLGFLTLLPLLFLPESPKFLLATNRNDEAIEVLKIVHKYNSRNWKQQPFLVRQVESDSIGTNLNEVNGIFAIIKLIWHQTWPLFMPPHLKNTAKLCFLMFVLFSIGNGTFMWMPDIISTMIKYIDQSITMCGVVHIKMSTEYNSTVSVQSPEECTVNQDPLVFQIILISGIIYSIIYTFMGSFIDKIGRRLLLGVWLTLTAISCLGVIWSLYFYLTIILIVLFMSCTLCASILSAISVELFPTNIRAMALCLILMTGRIGAVAGSNFFGALVDVNCDLIFYIFTALIIVCIIICFFIAAKPET